MDGGDLDARDMDSGDMFGPCSAVAHDPVLGTARLASGFRLVGSVELAQAWATGVVPGARGPEVFAISSAGHVHALGAWPALDAPADANRVYDALVPADRARQLIGTLGPEGSGSHLLAGYRTATAGSFHDERVALFNTAAPDAGVLHLDAPGHESLSTLGSNFLVGARGLGALSAARGVYALNVQTNPPAVALAAAYPDGDPSENVRPGPIAHTTQGLTVIGYYLDAADRHSLRLVPPAALAEAMSGGTPVALAGLPELTPRDDVRGAAGFGAGVAVLHSRWAGGLLYGLGTLRYYPLSVQGGVVSAGAPQDVLDSAAHDEFGACTSVHRLEPVGEDLLVTLADRERTGVRLVRIARQ